MTDLSGTVIDPSGSVIDPSGTVIDPSGSVIDPSGSVIDPSGSVIDPSGTVIDPSGTVIDPSGSVIDPSGSVITDLMTAMMASYEPPPPQIITLSDILNEKNVLVAKEASDKALIDSIESLSLDVLKPKLIQWALNGFPNAFPVYEFSLTLPACCSDGNHRCLAEYITFCSGKPIQDHVALLQARMPDIHVTFCNTGRSIQIVVST